ncbi:MAG TPA: peptidylprolyl isomerase [Cellvibrionaceae bacterium]
MSGINAVAAESPVVVRWGDVTVTTEDLERYVAFQVPEEDPAEVLGKPGNIEIFTRNIMMMRALAARAKEKQVGPDAAQLAWQKDYQQDSWLASAYQRNEIQQAHAEMEWEAYAREVYIAEPDRYTRQPRVDVAHILINTEERGEEEALELIKELHRRALAGEDFNALAREYSEDPSAATNGGELGVVESRKLVPEFASAAFALTEPGSISEPVLSTFGYHIIKLNKKFEAQRQSFERVKRQLIDDLKHKVASETTSFMLGRLRGDTLTADYDMEVINAFRKQYGLPPIVIDQLTSE